jgi:hypothetical protein
MHLGLRGGNAGVGQAFGVHPRVGIHIATPVGHYATRMPYPAALQLDAAQSYFR